MRPCVAGPNPARPATRPSARATARSSRSATPSSLHSAMARLGPMPSRRAIPATPSGMRARSLASAAMSPVSHSSRIFAWSVAPMSGSSVARPSMAIRATDRGVARMRAAARR